MAGDNSEDCSGVENYSSSLVNTNSEENDRMELESVCEIVVTYKCRSCNFVSNDKSTLLAHAKQFHSQPIVRKFSTSNYDGEQIRGLEKPFDISKIKLNKEELHPVPSVPPTPDAFFSTLDDDEDEIQDVSPPSADRDQIEVNNGSSETALVPLDRDRDPMEMDDVFLCAECDIVFASKEACCKHMHEVHELEHFNVEFIQETFVSRPEREELFEQDEHLNEGPSPASGQLVSTNISNVRSTRPVVRPPSHIRLNRGILVPRQFRVFKGRWHCCSKCSVRYEKEDVLKLHEKCHTDNDDALERTNCSTSTSQNRHNADNNDEDRRINNDNEASTDSAIASGGSERSTEYKFKCPLCEDHPEGQQQRIAKKTPTRFSKWSNCASHLWRIHQFDCELYSCSKCSKFKSYYITKVKDHERIHKPETSYVCNVCNKKFKQKKQLTTHEKFHKEKMTKLSPPEDSRWYTPKECSICKRVLSDAKCLKKHISAVHNKLKPYSCQICGHMTARKAELKLHVRQHTGEKPFKCPTCPFATGDHNTLRRHKLLHGDQDEYPYLCKYCGYSTVQSAAYKNHISSAHPDKEQEAIFPCNLCSHTSVNETLAKAHQIDHKDGRIPPPDETSRNTASSSPSANDSHDEDSNSSNEYPEIGIRSFGRNRATRQKPKSPQKPRWLEEDSVDVIDTGGVTIPASPPPAENLQNLPADTDDRVADS